MSYLLKPSPPKHSKCDDKHIVVYDDSHVFHQLHTLMPGLPTYVINLQPHYYADINSSIIECVDNIRFNDTRIQQLDTKQRVAVASWLADARRFKYIPDSLYKDFCRVAFPAYISNEDPECMQYWQPFIDILLYTTDKMQLSDWPLLKSFVESNISLFGLQHSVVFDRFNKMNIMQLAYCAHVVYVYSRRHQQTQNKFVATYCSELRVLSSLITTDDISKNFIQTFIRDVLGTGRPPMLAEIQGISADLAQSGLSLARDPHAIIQSLFNCEYKTVLLKLRPIPKITRASVVYRPSYIHIAYIKQIPKSRDEVKILNKVFPYTSDVDKLHMITNAASLVYRYLNPTNQHIASEPGLAAKRLQRINWLLRYIRVGTNQVMFCTMFIAALGHQKAYLIEDEILTRNVLLLPLDLQKEAFKNMSIAVRRTQKTVTAKNLSAMHISALAYFELAFGRSKNVTDWDNEIKIRCTVTSHIQTREIQEHVVNENGVQKIQLEYPKADEVHKFMEHRDPVFYEMLEKHLYHIVAAVMSEAPKLENFREFCARRHEWVVSGASGGIKVSIPKDSCLYNHRRVNNDGVELDGAGMYVRGDKRAVMETLTLDELENMLSLPPQEFAKACEKYENGKSRSIYAVTMIHYIICSWVTDKWEENMMNVPGFEKGVTGLKEYATQQKKIRACANPMIECTMLDYADFNIQHTPEAQAILFKVTADIAKQRGYSGEYVKAALWLTDAKYNMGFSLPGSNEILAVKQGLFSGTKTTDIHNSMLNMAYFKIGAELLEKRYNLVPRGLYHVHQGDDVFIVSEDRHWGCMLYYTLSNQGFVFNPKKQMFGVGFGEFLRVLYHKDGALGYAVRSIVNYVLRPLQNARVLDVQAQCRSLWETYAVMQRRGIDVIMLNDLYDTDLMHWAQVRAHATDRSPISLPAYVIQTDAPHGGFACPRPGTMVVSNVYLPHTPNLTVKAERGNTKLPSHMTNDWIAAVSRLLPESSRIIKSESLRSALFRTNYYSVLKETGYGADTVKYKKDWSNWLNAHSDYGRSPRQLDVRYFTRFLMNGINDQRLLRRYLCKNEPCNIDLDYYRQMISINLDADLQDETVRVSAVVTMLQRIFIKSVFKDVSTTATALGTNRALATTWIIEACITEKMRASDDTITISTMLERKHAEQLIDFLTTINYGVFNILIYHMSPSVVLEAMRIAKEVFFPEYMDEQYAGRDLYTTRFNDFVLSLITLFTDSSLRVKPVLF